MKGGFLVSSLALGAALLAGCDGDDDAAPPRATVTPVRTATSAAVTLTRTAAATATVSPSGVVPTATPPPLGFQFGRCIEAVGCEPNAARSFRSQQSCCDLALASVSLPFSWCPEVAIDDVTDVCSQCLPHPCVGLPTRTPTPSPPPA